MSKAVGSQKTSSKKEKPGNNVDSSQSDNSCDEKVYKLSSSTNLPSYITVPESHIQNTQSLILSKFTREIASRFFSAQKSVPESSFRGDTTLAYIIFSSYQYLLHLHLQN